MSCANYKRLCNKLVISQAVNFDGTNLIIDIPTGTYNNCEKYCIVVAQNIPTTATITAPVFITIGGGTATYPLLNCDCTAATACSINRRTRYSVKVRTDVSSGSFVLLDKLPCSRCNDNAASLPIETTTDGG